MESLRLFVYGTLKRGQRNHDRFCQGAVDIQEAQVRGRLYEGPGFPVLEVPEEDILAVGTSNPLADVATQQRLAVRLRSVLGHGNRIEPSDDWDTVYGELLTFNDTASRLVNLDYLEGFDPDGSSVYTRVLAPITVIDDLDVAWMYAVGKVGISQHRIASGRWSE